jgi:uridine monophosphate synthetase
MKIPLLQIRSDVKKHGTKKIIEGILPKKYTKIVLIDDLISTGATKVAAIEELRSKGYIVKDLVVLIDRTNDEGKKIMEEARVKIHSLATLDIIIEWLMKSSIDPDKLSAIKDNISKWQEM